MNAAQHRCPRCHAAYPGPVSKGVGITCDTCGNQWIPAQASDEYLPVEDEPIATAAPLTERRAPAHAPDSPAGLPFDSLEEEAGKAGPAQRPASDTAFRPSTEGVSADDRCHCPVCGHAFSGRHGQDEQRCPACGTSFVRSTGRLATGAGQGGDRLIGRVLRGCQIDRKLGEGGMGSVYHANQLSLDRSVAIKVLPPELARNRNFIQRFEREAKSLARINHANILQIYDFGEDAQLGVYFMVIEYVDGWDLGEVLRRQPTLSQIETLDIVRQALLGLEQAAEKGVIHRDIKPDNLMVALSGLCKVSDFGLAKGEAGDSEVTSVGVRVGTPAFMSPEQCDGVEVDSRSDVYNLGCTAFLMLTGHLPYDGETPFSIMLKHKVDPVPSVRMHRADIEPSVEALIRRMMAKKPDDRCFDLRELIDESEQVLIKLTGTASVLRKTNGPIRALAGHSSGGSSSRRGAAIEAAAPAAAPAPRPSSRQRSVPVQQPPSPSPRAPANAGVPDWLRPVDVPSAASPAAPTPPSPPAGSRTGPAPAIGSRTASLAAMQQPRTATGQPPPTLATPFPGLATPLPGERRASSSSSSSVLPASAMDRVRERGIKAEVASIAAGAERLAATGHWDQAASEWRRAAHLARDPAEGRRLAEQAALAQGRARRRRRLHAVTITAISVVLLGVNLWIWPPVVHNLIADRERARLESLGDPVERSRRLREFAAANQGGWRWYRTLFMRSYEVRAAAAAAVAAEQPSTSSQPTSQPPTSRQGGQPTKALGTLSAMADDRGVPWQQVVDAARPLAAASADAAAVLASASQALSAATEARARIDAARRQGHHDEALRLAAVFPVEHPRAGALLRGLPLPGVVRAIDPDSRAMIPGLRLSAEGVQVVGEAGRFCRSADAATALEVSAPGYVPRQVSIPAAPGPDEQSFDVVLVPAPVWRVAAPETRPAWLRLHPAGGAAIVVGSDAVQAIDAATGAVRPLTVAGIRPTPWWSPVEGGWAFATTDGEQRQILPSLDRAVPVRRLGGAPQALIEIDLVYRAGGRLVIAVEGGTDSHILVARDGPREAWRLGGLAVTHDPILRRVDDKIVVIDDLTVRAVEEDGSESVRLNLQALRTGPWAEAAGGRLLVATVTGVQAVQLGKRGVQLNSQPWLAQAGPAVPIADGATVALAREGDRTLDIATWNGAEAQVREHVRLSGRPVQASIADGLAVVVDDAGVVTVVQVADGTVIRRFLHGVPPAAAPIIVGGTVVVADQTGAVAGYRLPAR